MKDIEKKSIGTIAIHGGQEKNPFGALATPIYQTSTFIFDSVDQGGARFAGKENGYIYSRLGNPTVAVAENKIALLEKGESCVGTSSGMGAISSTLWTILKSGDHILADKVLYGCTFALLSYGLTKFGIQVEFIDMSDLNMVKSSLKENTKVIYLETPANPDLKVCDINLISSISHSFNNQIQIIVDNTFGTPYCQNPLTLGADIVVHSATKYLNGHGDVIAGFVVGKKETIDDIRLLGIKDMTGAVLSPHDASLIIRGLKTFEIRMKKHCDNAITIANFLSTHPKVKKVYYPGLSTHQNFEIAKKQMKNFGGIVSFELKDGFDAGKKLLNCLNLCSLAVSLGDTETLIQHPASMTHSSYSKEELKNAGLSEGLVRLSVGIEDVEDIIEDLKKGLDLI
ncbi:methionine gamma-lyase [Cetobacterium sp.]|uniref:methionine gamma-lyase n=1 Tax=Cetobacterium sp. TaxID=2071632 RepID=UPI003AEF1E73